MKLINKNGKARENAAHAGAGKTRSKLNKGNKLAWAFLTPSLLGVLGFFVLPFTVVIYYSFVENSVTKKFVGLANYIKLAGNSAFKTALGNSTLFSVIAVPLAVMLAMGLALLIDRDIPFMTQIRTSFLTPLMVPTASIVLIWQVLFDYKGVLNKIIAEHGGTPKDFLKSTSGLFVIMLLFLWKNIGYNMVLFLAALGNVPKDGVEAAELDGAGAWQIFWHIKFRYMSPMILFTTILSIINSFKIFREIYLLTGDYPVDSMYMLQHYMNNTFSSADYQKLSTAAIYLSLIMIVVIGLLFLFEHHYSKDLEEE